MPSSNTVVEPTTNAIVAGLPEVSAHFSRFKLTAVAVDDPVKAYYESGLMIEAAKLLADARCHVITWNGSSGGIVGFDRDHWLCGEIERLTGIPATTSSLALLDVFRATGVRRFALITLNPPAINDTIVRHFAQAGYECVGSTHRVGLEDNFAMASIPAEDIGEMIEACVAKRPDAITVFGTNTRGAFLADRLEREQGIPIYDTVAVGVWKSLKLAGVDTRRVRGWGRLFDAL